MSWRKELALSLLIAGAVFAFLVWLATLGLDYALLDTLLTVMFSPALFVLRCFGYTDGFDAPERFGYLALVINWLVGAAIVFAGIRLIRKIRK